MELDALLAIIVVAAAMLVMAREWLEPALALGGALGAALLLGLVAPQRALEGFANPAVFVIALLFVLAGALENSPWLNWTADALFGEGTRRGAGWRALVPVAGLSAVISNTTVIAVLIPAVREWARRNDLFASKLLMPISFAAILGGSCTLIGTSTNLVVSGMLQETTGDGFGMFELAWAAIPMTIVGIVFLVTVGHRLLPDRSDPLDQTGHSPREYVGRFEVQSDGPLVGRRCDDMRHLPGVYCLGIERGGKGRARFVPGEPLQGGDIVVYAGLLDAITNVASMSGLSPAQMRIQDRPDGEPEFVHMIEVVVSQSAAFLGRSVREANFRDLYDAVILAVHRHGHLLEEEIGEIFIHAGDTLLLLAGPEFLPRSRFSRDFYLVSHIGHLPDPPPPRDWLEPAVLLAAVVTAALGVLPILHSVIAAIFVLLALRRIRPADSWTLVQWPTLVMIAASVGLGHMLLDTGAAGILATILTSASAGLGPYAAIGVILLGTSLMTEAVTNVAAAALIYPIALVVGQSAGLEPHAMAAAVAIGASTSFATPVGYHTNAMVQGAAAYSFGDFLRLGVPLKLIAVVVGTIAVTLAWS